MMAFLFINQMYLFHYILVAYVFFMICMNTPLSCGSEMMVGHSNMTTVTRCIETERQALLLFKQGLVDMHGLLSSWGSPQEEDCCQWTGVWCDNHTGHVTRLNLSYYVDHHLSFDYFDDDDDYTYEVEAVTYPAPSNISHSLLDLKKLNYLDLSWNDFGKLPIPKFICSLSNLVYLDLSNANLGGAIPEEIRNLSRLNHLDLSSNFFDSSIIPKFIASFYSLRYLGLSNNPFFGAIPHELGNLSKLNHLDLSSNWFDYSPIPKSIASITSLRYLDLSVNEFTGAIPHELGNLSNLHHLDLSYNPDLVGANFGWLLPLSSLTHLDLSGINFDAVNNHGKLIQRLPSLSVLNLNGCNLNSFPFSLSTNSSSSISTLHLRKNQLPDSIFDWLSNLSGSLVDLDHSFNQLGHIPESSANLTAIKILDLSHNQLDGVNTANSFRNLSSLEFLDLRYNNLSGNLEDILYLLPENSLQVLLLSCNKLIGSLPDITRFSSLRKLEVKDNHLNGYLPKVFEQRSRLSFLVLSNNYLRGSLPSFTGFSYLRYLSLEDNNFFGSLPDFAGLPSLQTLYLQENNFSGNLPAFTGLKSLRKLYLDHNGFSGNLPEFTGLQSLTELHLGHNKFSGSLPDFTGCSSLLELRLEENQITEWKTPSIGQLKNLYLFNLSMNSVGSAITESHLSNLSRLAYMDASFNSLSFNFSSGWLPPFQLSQLILASCKLGPKFPNWIRNQTELSILDFSNTQISDTIPMWFGNGSLYSLDLSFNNIRGDLSLQLFDVIELDLSSNNFEGQIPLISNYASKINLSRNKFSGELLSLYAVERMDLNFLDCSHNLMFGVLPDSWVHFPSLAYFDIGHNKFSGMISMSIGYLTSLQTLILRNNSFYGELPDSLRNCSNLGFADVGLNELSGKIPAWIGKDLQQLYALILRSNKFNGSIPYYLCHLSNLHFLDLSINKISGSVPQCFGNLTEMIETGSEVIEHYYNSTDQDYNSTEQFHSYAETRTGSYVDTALAGWKGQELEYGRNFAYLKMIDLSTNELTGEIPIGLTKLLDLKGLNLSRNKFYGEVPQEIGGLNLLECLDLSRNKFSGEIPQNLSGLNFLAYLDLSYNNFSGRIPSGTQLQSFNASVYEMNIGLCGPPLEKICPGDEPGIEVQPSSDGNEADEDETEYKRWLYISATLGFGTTFWGICGILVLNRHWRHAYFLFLNNLMDQIYVIMAVHIARFRH